MRKERDNTKTSKSNKIPNTVIVHSDGYKNWIFDSNHPTQGRRFTKAFDMLRHELESRNHSHEVMDTRFATHEELERIHAPEYIEQVLYQYLSDEWDGARPDLAMLASQFVGGTLVALEALLSGRFRTAVHFPGAKHHAQYDFSSGFCVFNDFAIAADIASKDYGLRVAIYDFDAHHGDGTENLTAENSRILTLSVHEYGIFPGTGDVSFPEKNVFNVPLTEKESAFDVGKGDDGLGKGFGEFLHVARDFKPDLIMVAAGADGHREDPLTNLTYSEEEIILQGTLLRQFYPEIPILIGGAGGYQPDTFTPSIWAGYSANVATSLGWQAFAENTK